MRTRPESNLLAVASIDGGLREVEAAARASLAKAVDEALLADVVRPAHQAEVRATAVDNLEVRVRAARRAQRSADGAIITDPVRGLGVLLDESSAAIAGLRSTAPSAPRWLRWRAFRSTRAVRRHQAQVEAEVRWMRLQIPGLSVDLLAAAREEVRAASASVERRDRLETEAQAKPSARQTRLGRVTDVELTSYRETLLPELVVSTAATQDLERRIRRVGGSSIGLAGPRGAGKSTLLRVASQVDRRGPETDADAPPRHLGVVVPAPVAYEPLAFFTVLASALAQAVEVAPVYRDGDQVTWHHSSRPDGHPSISEPTPIRTVDAAAVGAAALLLGGGSLALATEVATVPSTAGMLRAGVVVLIANVLLTRSWLSRPVPRFGADPRVPRGSVALRETVVSAIRWCGQIAIMYALAKLANGALQRVGVLDGGGWVASISLRWHEDGLGGARIPVLAIVVAASLAAWERLAILVAPASYALWVWEGVIELRLARARPRGPRLPENPARWIAQVRSCHALHRRLTALVTHEHGTEQGGELALGPVSFSFGSHAARSAAEQPLTLPEAVTALRDMCAEVAALYGRLVIGVDELDKLASQNDAATFLNQLKALFGIPGVTFLVTVSDSAVASFQRRGVPFRDAFDSAFDEVVRVPPLELASCRDLLVRRTQGAVPSEAMVWIAFTLSGGLPRDLVRISRMIVDAVREEGPKAGVAYVARCVALTEIQEKASGFAERSADQVDEGKAVATWEIHDLARARSDVLDAAMWRQVREVEDIEDDHRTFVAYAALVLTVSDLLADAARDDQGFRLAVIEDRTEADEGPIIELRRARSRLAVSPLSALKLVLEVRRTEGLPDLVPAQARARTPWP